MKINKNSIKAIIENDNYYLEKDVYEEIGKLNKKEVDNTIGVIFEHFKGNNTRKLTKNENLIKKRIVYINKRLNCLQKRKNSKCDFKNIDSFIKWWCKKGHHNRNKDDKTLKCYYCGCTELQLMHLHRNMSIDDYVSDKIHKSKKRQFNSNNMQIDRIKPNEPYSNDNCVFACPFCNNSKSDIFSSSDYKKYLSNDTRNYIDYLTKAKKTLFSSCSNSEDILSYLEKTANSHRTVRRYLPKIEYFDIIKKHNCIVLGEATNLNDIEDDTNFKSDEYKYYIACLTYGTSENIAMWVHYCGKGGLGFAIEYNNKELSKIATNNKGRAFFINYKNIDEIEPVDIDDEGIFYRDVIYKTEGKAILLTRAYENFNVTKIKDIQNTLKEDLVKKITKVYPWRYENECRLVVRIKKDLVPCWASAIIIKFDESKYRINKDQIVLSPYFDDRRLDYEISALKGKVQ